MPEGGMEVGVPVVEGAAGAALVDVAAGALVPPVAGTALPPGARTITARARQTFSILLAPPLFVLLVALKSVCRVETLTKH